MWIAKRRRESSIHVCQKILPVAPRDLDDYPVNRSKSITIGMATTEEKKEEIMPEKSKKDVAARKSTPASATKKDETIVQVKAKPRSRAPGKQQISGKTEESLKATSKLTTFRLEAPQASRVFLAGCFNGWDPTATPLKCNQEGVWTCAISIPAGEHQYRFIVDGEWRDDPLNSVRCWNEFGTENCVLSIEG
jgi:hypothetical protein